MKLLVLGGTRFVGYHMVEAAVARGHDVTIFHRGQSGDRPAGVDELLGDRTGDLAVLKGRRWDAVLDACGYVPGVVEASARAVDTDFYAFVSTVSVYRSPAAPGLGEDAPLDEELDDATALAEDMHNYGALKVACERTVERVFPGAALQIRPGIVAGPRDRTDRFTYWADRVARGGRVLVPAPAERLVQFIDARDLAEFTVRSIEARRTGAFNVVRPATSLGEFLDGLRAATGSDASFCWSSDPEAPELFPLIADGPQRYLLALGAQKAIAAGLTFRDLAVTARGTLAWRPAGPMKVGPSAEEEARLLALQGT
jgi:2'-hydroxyisoflavone reductase